MRRFPQPSSPPLTSICRRTSALRSSLQFPSASPFPSSDPALPGCKPGLHPMGAESRARRPAEVPSRRREPPSAQRPGALPGFCGDVARAVQAACGRATAPRRVSGGEPVRLGGRLGIPKGRAPWESQVVLQAGRARRRSRAAGLWRARRPPAPPSRHPHKTREGHPAFAQMAAPAFAKAPPPAGGRAIRHPSDASRACIRARPDQTTERVRQMGTAARNARPTFDDISRSRAERTAAGSAAYPGGMTVRVSYAGEVTLEEAVSHYLAARQNAMEAIGPAKASA